jgi:hypothetical protein
MAITVMPIHKATPRPAALPEIKAAPKTAETNMNVPSASANSDRDIKSSSTNKLRAF